MMLYYAGRIFQLIGLIAMPSAIWAGEYLHNEPISIGIFAGAILVFALGTLFLKFSGKGGGY